MKQIDNVDLITILFHVRQPSNGGGTSYYFALTSDALAKQIPCQYENLINGCFDDIIQNGEAWEGLRRCINLNLMKKILKHILSYDMKYHTKYESNNYRFETIFNVVYYRIGYIYPKNVLRSI